MTPPAWSPTSAASLNTASIHGLNADTEISIASLRAQSAPLRGKLRLPVFKGRGGLLAGFDPLSNQSWLDALGDDA